MEIKKLKTALTIAGSDSSGGAGIQADIKTMLANGVYAMSAITAMTAQNTMGVRAIQESTPDFLKEQLDSGSCSMKHLMAGRCCLCPGSTHRCYQWKAVHCLSWCTMKCFPVRHLLPEAWHPSIPRGP